MVAIAPTSRKPWKKLEKLGLTDRGELFETVVAPPEIDEDDDVQGEATDWEGEMFTDSQRHAVGTGEAVSWSRPCPPRALGGSTDLFDREVQEYQAELQRMLAKKKPELIRQESKLDQCDLPRLLAENRYLQQVAYRGNEMVAIASSRRQLWKKLRKLGLAETGELYTTVVCARRSTKRMRARTKYLPRSSLYRDHHPTWFSLESDGD